jgi:hypothetical protein
LSNARDVKLTECKPGGATCWSGKSHGGIGGIDGRL